jgi:hypothetical protein
MLGALEKVGLFVLHRGTIEDYYLQPTSDPSGKSAAAATEASAFSDYNETVLRTRYSDVLRAVEFAAPARPVDENAYLRGLLSGMLATAFQHIRAGLDDKSLNSFATVGNKAAGSVFWLENISDAHCRAIRVNIRSNLFKRPNFPFEIRFEDNLNVQVENKLPS